MASTIEKFAQLETLWDKAIQSPAGGRPSRYVLLHFDGALRRQGGEAQAREAEAFAPIMDPRCYRSGRRQKLGYVWYYHKGQEGWTEFQHQFEDILTTQMFAIVGNENWISLGRTVGIAARVSYSQWRHSFAWAIDPDWTRSGADEDGYDGRLKISATQIYFRFYEFISTKKYTLKDIWRDFHQVNKTQTYVPGPLPAWPSTDLDKPVWPDS
ncbi:hypothetical protein AFLA_005314 [Aspergillus flavus NRRL3357]|nr:hypothetical protein AFLA_005314 [Aspergillus flavus NRRL3357]